MNKAADGAQANTLPEFESINPAAYKRLGTATLSQMLQLSPDALYPALNLAARLEAQGAILDAMDLYGKLALLDPLNVDVHVGLAQCATRLGEHAIAIKAAASVITLAPENALGYLLSGKNCFMLGHYQEAREDLNDAKRLAVEDTVVAKEASLLLTRVNALSASTSGSK